MQTGPLTEYRDCDECGEPVPYLEQYQQVVEGGSGLAKGHRHCIEEAWGPAGAGDDR